MARDGWLEVGTTLSFLAVGHTKNICNGTFGHVKRKCRRTHVSTLTVLMKVTENRSSTTTCAPWAHIQWKNWADILSMYFTVPSGFKVIEFYSFGFEQERTGQVLVKDFAANCQHHAALFLWQLAPRNGYFAAGADFRGALINQNAKGW